jgi:hypothetical protein
MSCREVRPLLDDEAHETRVIAELLEKVPNLPRGQLLDLETISLWSAEWLDKDGEHERAKRFLGLARACQSVLAVLAPGRLKSDYE